MIINRETYLLAVIPPSRIIKYVDNFRDKYAGESIDRISPHITIFPPFFHFFSTELDLGDSISRVCLGYQPFRVNLTGVDFFEGKNNVAFFKPDDNSTMQLRNLLTKTIDGMSGKVVNKHDDYPIDSKRFVPHMTIAEQIPKTDFEKAKKELGEVKVNEEFDVNSIFLLKKEKKNWNQVFEIKF